jgi:hypothetical protein
MRDSQLHSPARIALGVATAILLAGIPIAAQQPTFKASTQIVSLFATVTDAQNRLVPDLTQDDFQIFDNDKPQQLVLFRSETQPITVVVMLDTSGSMTGSIALLKAAAEQFIVRLLPDDKAAVGACATWITGTARACTMRWERASTSCAGSRGAASS